MGVPARLDGAAVGRYGSERTTTAVAERGVLGSDRSCYYILIILLCYVGWRVAGRVQPERMRPSRGFRVPLSSKAQRTYKSSPL